jgi:hypothetical protein
MRFKAQGKLEYGPGIRAVVSVNEDIARYYRRLIPQYLNAKPQAHPAHLTVVRTAIEVPTNMEVWEKYYEEEVEFEYSNKIKFYYPYFFLDAWSLRIGDIREELGLSRFRIVHPFGYKNCYHITIANVKDNL